MSRRPERIVCSASCASNFCGFLESEFFNSPDDFTQNNLLIAPNMRAVILVGYRKTLAFSCGVPCCLSAVSWQVRQDAPTKTKSQEVESDTEAHKD